MAEILSVPTYEQIAVMLERLATNYSNLASVFYEIFYYDTPTDVTFSLYDEAGVLQTYTVPNRAKDMQNLLSGDGNPEGNVEASKGALYQDLTNGDLYIKETEGGSEGWYKITTDNFLKSVFIQGNGSPEGNVEAPKGILYIDTDYASLYIKTTLTGTTGWQMISATVGTFADVDLSNLSSIGENKFLDRDLSNITPLGRETFADRSLANLTEVGQEKFREKEDIRNKVTELSSSSTNTQFPSAKCVYDALGTKQSNLISGENIKTINGQSILGRGNVEINIDVRDQIKDILSTMYPVGSIYLGTTSTCPLSALFGTWTLVSQDRVLQGSSSSHPAGTLIEAGLPEIEGTFGSHNGSISGGSGAFKLSGDVSATGGSVPHFPSKASFNASRANTIYGQNDTVQPPAYVVNVWRRTA